MVFITAGMGGGTGTGGAPVVARAARAAGVLTVGVVTKPFQFEGAHRMQQAEAGLAELIQHVDTLIVIPNQNLFRVADEKTSFADAFKMADEVLHSGVRGVTDLIILPGLINLDFADVRSIMAGMGNAVMGTGEAEGDNRALAAAEAAISNPLLDDISMKGARSVLINITGGMDLMLTEVDEAANRIRKEVDPDANIIFGSALNENLDAKIRVSVIATGNDIEHKDKSTPKSDQPFVLDQAEDGDIKPAVKIGATGTAEQVATSKEPAQSNVRLTTIERAYGSNDAPAQCSEESSIERRGPNPSFGR
jgi:cell division protein FtsZ